MVARHPDQVARPRGSTNGRRPPGGYPEVSCELAGFLAGFLEGEACFSISKQAGHDNHRCWMSLVARDDDRDLILELAQTTALGSCTARAATHGSRSQVQWSVGAKSDCQRLVQILDICPMRGRKSLDFAVWRAAVEWWIGADPKSREADRDWTPIAYLKERLHEVKRFSLSEVGREIVDTGDGLEPDWGSYLSGYFTAEGCFGIYASGGLKPKAQLRVRHDDRPLLDELRRRVGVGRLYDADRPANEGSPCVSWAVCSRDDLSRLAEVFDEHPPRGRKLREYEIWREAVVEYAKGERPAARQARLSELRAALAAARAYRAIDTAQFT